MQAIFRRLHQRGRGRSEKEGGMEKEIVEEKKSGFCKYCPITIRSGNTCTPIGLYLQCNRATLAHQSGNTGNAIGQHLPFTEQNSCHRATLGARSCSTGSADGDICAPKPYQPGRPYLPTLPSFHLFSSSHLIPLSFSPSHLSAGAGSAGSVSGKNRLHLPSCCVSARYAV